MGSDSLSVILLDIQCFPSRHFLHVRHVVFCNEDESGRFWSRKRPIHGGRATGQCGRTKYNATRGLHATSTGGKGDSKAETGVGFAPAKELIRGLIATLTHPG